MNQYCPGKLENSNKLEVFMGILEESMAVGDRILLFSQSLLTLTLIEEFLRTKELTPSEVSHNETAWKIKSSLYICILFFILGSFQNMTL